MPPPRPRSKRGSRTLAQNPAELVPPDDALTITSIRMLQDGRTAAVTVSRRTVARVRAADLETLGIAPGMSWTDDLAATLYDAAKRHAAQTHALRLTAARARTSRDLVRRLTMAGHARPHAEAAAELLADAGIIDDNAFADAAASSLAARRDTSRRGIEQKLIAKGVDRPAASKAAAEHRDAETDADNAHHLAARRIGRMRSIDDPQATRRRVVAYLQRRGFGLDDALPAVDAALADRASEDLH
ncbi:MAG: RecX family transcriptional regulator [Planctomycetota bacterium]